MLFISKWLMMDHKSRRKSLLISIQGLTPCGQCSDASTLVVSYHGMKGLFVVVRPAELWMRFLDLWHHLRIFSVGSGMTAGAPKSIIFFKGKRQNKGCLLHSFGPDTWGILVSSRG